MPVVYWIHLEEHTDILTQGYVGVSKTTAMDRFKSHKHSAKRLSHYPVHRAIRKYGEGLKISTVLVADHEYCYEIEAKLRSKIHTGWNIAVGGEQVTMIGRRHTAETRLEMSVTRASKGLSEDQLSKMLSGKVLGTPRNTIKAWLNPKANLLVWKDAINLFSLFSQYKTCGQRKLARVSVKFSSDNLETITKMFNSGWVPSEDASYIHWLSTFKE